MNYDLQIRIDKKRPYTSKGAIGTNINLETLLFELLSNSIPNRW